MPFINTSEATKRSSNRTENGKCTDVTNRRSRVGLSTPIYTNHRQLFSLSRIFTDLIMHNYQSNQSALMTRCGTDFRHQYGIFGCESQKSFTRNATWAGSEEGRLFSQARSEEGRLFSQATVWLPSRFFLLCSIIILLDSILKKNIVAGNELLF